MSDLFKKLNVLIKASLNDLLSDEPSRPRATVSPGRLGKDIERELLALRQRIDEALDYETRLQGRVKSLEEEAQTLDADVAEALQGGQDDRARIRQEQMLRARRGLEMARADLREHQLVTQDLIQRVNTLESYVAEVKRRNQTEQDTQDAAVEPKTTVADVLRTAREATQSSAPESAAGGPGSADDMDARRQRLMRPAPPESSSRPPET